MKSAIGKIILCVIIVIIAAAAYYMWQSTRDVGPGPGFAQGNGRIEATEIDIATKLAGRVMEIHVEEGDFVKKAQVVAVMQTDVLEAQLNEAKAKVAQAKAAEISAQAQVALRVSDVNAAKATAAQRRSEFDQTQRRLKRSETLSEQGVISGQQFDDDETTQNAALAAVDSAVAQIAVAEAGVEAAKAEAAGAVAATHAAEASVASIQADIDDSSLVSPRDGRIQYRIAQPGEVLAAGGRVLNFVDLSDVYMTFFLPEQAAGQVGIGTEARIILDAFPDYPIPAKISFVSSVAQFTPKTVETENERQKLMFRVKARVDPELLLKRLDQVKTGLPGVTWVRLDQNAAWPDFLAVNNEQ